MGGASGERGRLRRPMGLGKDSADFGQVGGGPRCPGRPPRSGVGDEGDRSAAGGRARLHVETEIADNDRFLGFRAERLHQPADARGTRFRHVVLAGDDGVERQAVPPAGALGASSAVARQDGRPDALRAEGVEEFPGAGHEPAAAGGLGFVAFEDRIGAGPLGLGEPVHRLDNGGARRQADLAADGLEIERRLQQRPIQVEDDEFHLSHVYAPHFISMFDQFRTQPLTQRHNDYLHPFAPSKLHYWDKVGVSRDHGDPINNPST